MTKTAARTAELRHILSERRREIQGKVWKRVRDGRRDQSNDGRDELERTDAANQGDIDLALLQMRAETLLRIDQAIVRLNAGEYGSCLECAREISARRLRALPFAVRCQSCEEQREQADGAERQLAQQRQRGGLPFLSNLGF